MSEIALLLELSAQGKREDSIVGFFFFFKLYGKQTGLGVDLKTQ